MLRTFRVGATLALVLVLAGCAEPPNKEMNQAQGAIDAARAAGADKYATQDLQAAADSLKRSGDAVAQNDYRLALSLAIESRERAQTAAKTAGENRARARGDAERIVAEVNSTLRQARTRLDDVTLDKLPRRAATELRNQLASMDKDMQEARAALAADDYDGAIARAKAVSARIPETLDALEKAATAPAPRRRR